MSTTWTNYLGRSSKAVCTTGTESAPSSTANPTEGSSLSTGGGFAVTIEAVTSGQTVAGGSLLAYLWDQAFNAGAGAWSRCPDLDQSISSTAAQRYTFQGQWISSGRGRIAFLPSGVTISSGSAAVYINMMS